jgi:hypothetical protein
MPMLSNRYTVPLTLVALGAFLPLRAAVVRMVGERSGPDMAWRAGHLVTALLFSAITAIAWFTGDWERGSFGRKCSAAAAIISLAVLAITVGMLI